MNQERKMNILFLSKDEELKKYVEGLLEGEGFNIFFSDEKSFLDKFKNKKIDIILLDFETVPVIDMCKEFRKKFGLTEADDDPVADENVQPRIRGTCLMDFSNRLKKLKIMVLNTGNKTELALGYCTLYGDLTGGLGVIGDVSKLDVYKLAKYVNEKYGREIIPKRVFTKKPSAELRPDQYDPFDFDIVSPMVDEIVEKRLSREELIQKGYPEKIVDDILKRIRRAEYKRWQAPPCLKITRKAFGIGWKMPIVNKYRE